MNSIICISKVLKRIVENIHSFKEGEDNIHLLDTVCKIGLYALENFLPCEILRNVFVILKRFPTYSANSQAASAFFHRANCFYKTKNLCSTFKLVFLSCFPPAVEFEVLQMLKLCSGIQNTTEMTSVKSTVLQSCLPSACIENPMMLHKVNCILKHCFKSTEGNPVVGYLISTFNKAVAGNLKPTDGICFISEDLSHLEILFSLQHELLCDHQKLLYFKQLISATIESVENKLTSKSDVMFLTVIFPSLFHQILVLHRNEIFDAFKFLRIVYNLNNIGRQNFRLEIDNILKNPIWKYLLES